MNSWDMPLEGKDGKVTFRRLPCVYSAIQLIKKKTQNNLINASVSVGPWLKNNRGTEESQLVWNTLISNGFQMFSNYFMERYIQNA